MKNFSDSIGNRTNDLPACRAVLQPNVPRRAPKINNFTLLLIFNCGSRKHEKYDLLKENVFVLPNHDAKLMRDVTSLFDNKNVILGCHVLSGHFRNMF